MEFNELLLNERAWLSEIKESVLHSPVAYFFYPIQSTHEFKELTTTIGMWQWRFIGSMCSSLLDTFKKLGEVFHSMASLQFFVVAERMTDVTKLALSVLAKLILNVALFLLHLIRFTTVVLMTCVAPIALLKPSFARNINMENVFDSMNTSVSETWSFLSAGVASFFQSPRDLMRKKLAKELEAERQEFENLYSLVSLEKQSILKQLNDYGDYVEGLSLRNKLESGTSSTMDVSNTKWFEESPLAQEYKEVLSSCLHLSQNYPVLDLEQVKCPGYLTEFCREYSEHHVKFMSVVSDFFSVIEKCKRQGLVNEQRIRDASLLSNAPSNVMEGSSAASFNNTPRR